MKKVLSLFMLLLLVTGMNAQDKKKDRKEKAKARMERTENMTPDQIAELQTKKMAIDLDLSDAQQKEIFEINKAQAIKRKEQMSKWRAMREEGERPSENERMKMMSARLDEQKALQDKMKSVLNDEQFAKWKANQEKQRERWANRRGHN